MPPSLVVATLYHRDSPFDEAFAEFFDRSIRPVTTESGATPVAWLQTEHAENTFPALPVRTGENVFARFSRFADQADFAGHLQHLDRSRVWRDQVQPGAPGLPLACMVVVTRGDCGGGGREVRAGPGVARAGPVQRLLAVVRCAA